MDRREGMMLPGSTPYYMQMGMSGTGSGTVNIPGSQGAPSINPSLPSANMPYQSSSGGASVPQTLVVDPSSTLSPRGSISGSSAFSQGEPVRRRRGRPRKYGAQAAMSLALNPPPSTQAMALTPKQKRGRGRPPGTGRKQQPSSFGGWLSNTAGIGFTPHVITIAIGEDITSKIMSFSQQGPRSICILSANGVISTVTLRQPSTSGGAVTYEGRFEILSLSGSFLVTDSGGSQGRIGSLNITLASPDGRVIGGGVGGALIAASPIQIIVGSFLLSSSKAKKRAVESVQSAGTSDLQTTDSSVNPADVLSNQNLTSPSSIGIWPSSEQLDLQAGHMDIDLMRG